MKQKRHEKRHILKIQVIEKKRECSKSADLEMHEGVKMVITSATKMTTTLAKK